MDLILKNNKNETLDLLNNRDKFVLSGADALHGIDLSYSENESPYVDGTSVDNVRAMPRGIILILTLMGDIEESRNFVKSFVKSKQRMTLVERTDDHEIQIQGIAKIPTYTHMEQMSKISIELYCNFPYWQDSQIIIDFIKQELDLLYFPIDGIPFGIIDENTNEIIGRTFGEINSDLTKNFTNDGDADTGMIIEIVAISEITNPRISCSSGNQNGWYMQINYTLQQNDVIQINTMKGQKSITYNGSTYIGNTPVLSLLSFVGNDWLQLELGDNTFNVTSDSQTFGAYFDISYRRLYE